MNHKQVMQTESKIILTLLRERNLRANIVGGYVTPGYYVYQLRMDATQKYAKLEELDVDMQRLLYAGRVRNRIVDPNDTDQIVTVRIQPQPLVIEVNRPEIDKLHYAGVMSQLARKPVEYTAIAGLSYATRTGQAITWRLDNPAEPHCMVAGGTGSGKSVLLLNLVFSVCEHTSPHRLSVAIVDGGNSTLNPLANLPHSIGYAGDVESSLELAEKVYNEVLRRKKIRDDNPQSRLLMVTDELANLQTVMDKAQLDLLQRYNNVITAEGRKYGVHCIVCTQKPLAEVTGSLAKTNMAKRFVGAVPSKQDAVTCAGIGGTGAEALAGKGDFITVRNSTIRRFQAMYIKSASAIVQDIQIKWRGLAAEPLEPVQGKKRPVVEKYTSEPVVEPVQNQFKAVHEPVVEPLEPLTGSGFPLEEKRPLTKRESALVRHLSETMSKNMLCIAVYGAKSGRYMEWINEALQDEKIIRLRKTA